MPKLCLSRLVGVVAFLMADQHDPAAAEPAEAADDRLILAEGAVAGQRHEILDQAGDIILEMRPLGMAGDLGLLPGRQLGIGVAQQPLGACPRAGAISASILGSPADAVSRSSAIRASSSAIGFSKSRKVAMRRGG